MLNSYLNPLEEQFFSAKNIENAIPMKKYLKNKFEFFGIKSPERKEIEKSFFKINGLPELEHLENIVRELWEKDEREYQYFALVLLDKMKRKTNEKQINLYESLITHKSWWDTVDFIAASLIGNYFTIFPDKINEVTKKWMNSGNIWLQRSCILFQLKYRNNTNFKLLKLFIHECRYAKEFFIQKAIGWSLREYSKTNPAAVAEFIRNNQLAPLSVREGLKIITKKIKPIIN